MRPRRFTYPYQYTPHPLCVAAAGEVRRYLAAHPPLLEAASEGKMFGVLIVAQPDGTASFLAAYSGELASDNKHSWFVPPVYDLLLPESHFQEEELEITKLNHEILQLQAKALDNAAQERITALKHERKARSQELQQWLFRQYKFLNAEGQERNLMELFDVYYTTHAPVNTSGKRSKADTPKLPPSGSGECCAPKLLQTAYLLGLQPIAMAEFWVGRSPKDELRIDGHYYPACSGKCRPILTHMLRGLDVEENPLLQRIRAVAAEMQVIHAEASFAVVVKPSGMLSVPGNDPELPNVLSEVKRLFPTAKGPIIVHRLDMDTSGLMVVALTDAAYHNLQQQFITHQVSKRYTALLSVEIEDCKTPARSDETSKSRFAAEGVISLPICPNPYDRPRQMVSEEYGKKAVTRYKYIDEQHVQLWPQTGRTHQLRVHCAHRDGLGRPIVGDELYGTPAARLCLHADTLVFRHPLSGEMLTFQSSAPF